MTLVSWLNPNIAQKIAAEQGEVWFAKPLARRAQIDVRQEWEIEQEKAEIAEGESVGGGGEGPGAEGEVVKNSHKTDFLWPFPGTNFNFIGGHLQFFHDFHQGGAYKPACTLYCATKRVAVGQNVSL